jgi:glucose-1-phosphate cytidylyltransferase
MTLNKRPEQVVILCGGLGTRLRDYGDPVPKPLVPIGGVPILHHVMKLYSNQGFKEFILCLGHKQDEIKQYFLNYHLLSDNFTLDLQARDKINMEHVPEDWKITFVDTGKLTLTAGRIKRIQKYITGDNFLATYTDGLSNVDLNKLLEFHKQHGKIATLTGARPESPFGMIEYDGDTVTSFKEKPKLEGFINGGFFAFNKKIFDYLADDQMLEEGPMKALVGEKQLAIFKHEGFWTSMDTSKDVERLNKMYEQGHTPWKI